jgi:hypothetical protein
VLAANSGQTEKEISEMKNLKKLVLTGLTLAGLAMATPSPAKADTLTTAFIATANAIHVVIQYNYGVIKWT